MLRSLVALGALTLGASTVLADPQTCSLSQKCPKEAPCCSQYGECGVGKSCLGGCDPRMSFSLDSCVAQPQCQSKKFAMKGLDGFVSADEYLGDPKTADWVYQGKPVSNNNDSVLLTMEPNSVGTVVASSTYMWYGTVSAKMKSSRGAGVVTAFILLGDVKDEIDYEFVGADLKNVQSNYFFQGVLTLGNGLNISVADTFDTWHTYELQWTPESVTWLVDGQVGRVLKKSDTWNATGNNWNFPQTPSRVQFSIWPAGGSSSAPGTIAWAGGPIDWNSQDIKDHGYDFATLGEVEIKCFDAKTAPGTNNAVSYTYKDARGTNDTIVNGDKPTVLKSLKGSGIDMNAEDPSKKKSDSSKTSDSTSSSTPGTGSKGLGSSGDAAASASASSSAPDCVETTFSQSCDSAKSASKSDGGRVVGDRIAGASAFAVIVALTGMMFM